MRDRKVVFLGNTEECIHSAMVAAAEQLQSPHGHFFPEDEKNYKQQINRLREKKLTPGQCTIVLKEGDRRLILTDRKDTDEIAAYVLCHDLYYHRQESRKMVLQNQVEIKAGAGLTDHGYSGKQNMVLNNLEQLKQAPVLLLYNQRYRASEEDQNTPGNLDVSQYIRKLFPAESYICDKYKEYEPLLNYLHTVAPQNAGCYYTRLRCSAYRHLGRVAQVQKQKCEDLDNAKKLREEIRSKKKQKMISDETVNCAEELLKDAERWKNDQNQGPDGVDKLVLWILYVTGFAAIPMKEVIPQTDVVNLQYLNLRVAAPECRDVLPRKQSKRGPNRRNQWTWKLAVAEAAVRCYLFENPTPEDLFCAHAINEYQEAWINLRGMWSPFRGKERNFD